ncbi:MAG: nitrogenase iron protein, partial [Dysosmobacter welbionis]
WKRGHREVHRRVQPGVVGCDPKADSTRGLMGRRIPTVLDQLKTGASGEIAFTDSRGVRCIEAGGPEPGTGCAGRGIIVAMEIRSRGLLDDRDVVLYDVLGDVVCGGFRHAAAGAGGRRVYLVTTSDFMALYAANNICRGIRKYAQSGGIRLTGIIHNGRSSVDNDACSAFATELGTTVAGKIPMSPLIGQAELERRTVVDSAPDSAPARAFRALASVLLDNRGSCIPEPMTDDRLEALCRKAGRFDSG